MTSKYILSFPFNTSKYPCFFLCCMCVRWSLHFAAFGFFKAVVVTSVKSLGHLQNFPLSLWCHPFGCVWLNESPSGNAQTCDTLIHRVYAWLQTCGRLQRRGKMQQNQHPSVCGNCVVYSLNNKLHGAVCFSREASSLLAGEEISSVVWNLKVVH
jgi:hypothetical protein